MRLLWKALRSGAFTFGTHPVFRARAFIDEGGNNFWGVEVHNIGRQQYVLASDRDFGLYIFKPAL